MRVPKGGGVLLLAVSAIFIACTVLPALALVVPDSGSRVVSSAGRINVTGSLDNNEVRVSYTGDSRFTVSDRTGVQAAGSCTQVDSRTASCESDAAEPDISFGASDGDDTLFVSVPLEVEVSAYGRGDGASLGPGGEDRFEIAAGSPARARFSGYSGSDTLIGASSYDFLSGGRGPDRLIGRGGDDRLLGAQRKDRFVGGTGDDRIEAARNDGDEAIRCGPGDDVAIVDRDLDPKPRECEKIKLR